MSDWKSKLIDSYRIATRPYRAIQMQRRRKRGTVPVFVLFYHRISDSHPNDWSMGCGEFERQIDWLQKNFEIVDLQESQRRIQSGFNQVPTVSITFDDGYAENCEYALPMLIQRRIPVTYFVTLDNVQNQQPFLHDLNLGNALPVNTLESLRSLDMAGIELGAHTRTHADLGKVTQMEVLVDEVVMASRELEQLIERKVRYFAFPFGQRENLNAAAFQLLKKAGFIGACTTLGGWNEVGGDPFQITRVHGDVNFARTRNWLTFDPRLGHVEPFDYENADVRLPGLDPPVFLPSGAALPQPTSIPTSQQ